MHYLAALGPFLVACIVAWIGWCQYQTSVEKLRLDLYDRRFSIYTAAIDFYHVLAGFHSNDETHKLAHREFIKAVRESRFLFGAKSEPVAILEGMHSRSARIMGFSKLPEDFSKQDPKLYQQLFERQQSDYFWIGGDDGLLRLERALAPFLDFQNAAGRAGLGASVLTKALSALRDIN